MAFSFQNIKYGWVALTGIVLTGTTIYVAVNTRHHVKQIDIIPVALGTYERCLATQYATNPLYRVAPSSFVRSWINTNGVAENVTNAFGNYIDKSMMDSLDTTIKQLVPYYRPSETGELWSVTSLWAYLNIGDGTSQFTRIPTIETNFATYGSYPQQIYVECLQERYKVLNALKLTTVTLSAPSLNLNPYWIGDYYYGHGHSYYTLEIAKNSAQTNYSLISTNNTTTPRSLSIWGGYFGGIPADLYANVARYIIGPFSTNFPHSCIVTATSVRSSGLYTNDSEWSSQGAISTESNWVEIINTTNSYNQWEESSIYGSAELPQWHSHTNSIDGDLPWYATRRKGNVVGGLGYIASYDVPTIILTNWSIIFQYCTNKYW